MKHKLKKYFPVHAVAAVLFALLLTGCVSNESSQPASMALRFGQVNNRANVKVKVSLANRAVYIYEGSEPKWAAAVAIGTPSNPTPTGNFKAFNKLPRKRSNTYGFWVNGSDIRPGKRSGMPRGYRYVGYPMPNWVEFKSGYGFHAGAVWPQPRSHGCLRIHKSVAGEFFHLVNSGTPIQISHSLPEDATIGKKIPRPMDYNHPDSPPSVLVTDAPFDSPNVYF
ncbi:MAG: L,D-transpeptidase [Verrucomicrobiales bacterium]|nr:L,D-transpeptidase [Verrucomicrobiales bacterium]